MADQYSVAVTKGRVVDAPAGYEAACTAVANGTSSSKKSEQSGYPSWQNNYVEKILCRSSPRWSSSSLLSATISPSILPRLFVSLPPFSLMAFSTSLLARAMA